MGLTSFKGVKVRKTDVTVDKNHRAMHMADWEGKLNQFLKFNCREVLQNFGTVKREVAEALAVAEYEKYDACRRVLEATDIDALTENITKIKMI